MSNHRKNIKVVFYTVLLEFVILLPLAVPGQNSASQNTFAIIGDFGLSGSRETSVANLVKSWNPGYIVTVGDNNYPDGEASTIDKNIGQYYAQYIHPYNGNYGDGADTNLFFPCLGNHDWTSQNAAAYYQYFTLPGNERYYDIVKGEVHFFFLDSDKREPDGYSATSKQAMWLKGKLASSSSKWKIVIFHHSPYVSDNVGSKTWMRWPFKTWGADIAFSGHSHVYERVIVDGFPYIVNGVGGSNLSSFSSSGISGSQVRYDKNFGAILANINQDTLRFKFYNINNDLIDNYPLVKISAQPAALSATITSPANNSSFVVGSEITIQANATGGTGTIQKVEFFANDSKLGEDPTSPYSFIWSNADSGSYSLSARATNSANDIAVSGIINITVSPEIIISPSQTQELISANSQWKYLDNGSNQGTAWTASSFNDDSWKTGNAELGYGDGGEATVVSYGTSSSNKYITTYFRKNFNVNDISKITALELSIIRDDGAVVYLNGAEVYRNNMPSGTISNSTLAAMAIDGSAESTYIVSGINHEGLFDGENVIAVEIHQKQANSSDISFNLKLKAGSAISNEFIPSGAQWKYLDNGSNQGTSWRALNFNDSLWKNGNAELGYGDGGESTVVSFGSSSGNKYITTYFRKKFSITDLSGISGLDLNLIRDDGIVVYLNGAEVYRNNMPGSTIFYNTLAPSYIDGANESTWVMTTISSANLVAGENIIAVEIHQNSPSSSDISFNLKLTGLSSVSNKVPADSISYPFISDHDSIYYSRGDFIVSPNPFNGLFTLEYCLDSIQEKSIIVELYNPIGQILFEKSLPVINACVKEVIELDNNILPGMYIMNVIADGRKESKRIILAK